MYAAMVSLVGMNNGFSVRIVVAPCAANAKPLGSYFGQVVELADTSG